MVACPVVVLACLQIAEVARSRIVAPTVHLEIERTVRDVRGVVRDHEGQPIEGATVRGSGGCFVWERATNADGRFSASFRSDYVTVSAPPHGSIMVTFTDPSGDATYRPTDSYVVAFERLTGLPFWLGTIVAILLSVVLGLRQRLRKGLGATIIEVLANAALVVTPTLALHAIDESSRPVSRVMLGGHTLLALGVVAVVLSISTVRRYRRLASRSFEG